MANTFIKLPKEQISLTGATINVDKTRIWDGSDYLAINADGSINTQVAAASVEAQYAEVSSVPSSSLTSVLSYTAIDDGYLKSVHVSGTNVAEYRIRINAVNKAKLRTYFTEYNASLHFGQGLAISAGDSVNVQVIHTSTDLGDFNATIELGST